jgi:hypothetical protein
LIAICGISKYIITYNFTATQGIHTNLIYDNFAFFAQNAVEKIDVKYAKMHFKRTQFKVETRVARWFVFKPKIPIWVNFGGSCNGSCWYILWPFGLFYGHLVYFVAI